MGIFTYRWFGLRKEVTVYDYEYGLFYKNGHFIGLLETGKYSYWRWENVSISPVNRRLISEVVNGQEILTADKIAVRVSLVAVYQIVDPVMAINHVDNYPELFYHDLQLALRDIVAGREMDALLDARTALSKELLENVKPLALEYGLDVKRIGVRDIVLPAQVRNVFMLEVEADREGRAELVKARHEVAAARARANTAKILTENPAVMKMQEIDALLKLAGKHGNVVMLPNLADLLSRRDSNGKE